FIFFFQLVRQGYTVGYGQLRAQVRYHTTYMVFIGTEVERTFPPFAEPFFASLPLHKELVERHFTSGEHTQVAVQGHDVLIGIQRHGSTHSYGLLPYAAKPLADTPLAQ